MPVQATEIYLERTFYSAEAYSANPAGSLYYTTGLSEEYTEAPYTGLYTVGALVESDIPGLYIIPPFGRTARTDDIVDYQAAEDATTLNPGNLNGGTSQITVSTRPFEDSEEFFTASLDLTDTLNGNIRGTVRGLSINDVGTSITADSLVALFNVYGTMPTAHANLRNALVAYCQAAGVSISITYEDGLANLPVRLPSQEGNVWDILKQVATAYQFEIAFQGGNMVVRRPRKTTITTDRATDFTRDINAQEVSKKVRVHYYKNEYLTQHEVYPLVPQPAAIKDTDENEEFVPEEPTIYTVDAGETLRFTLDLNASLVSVNQPKYVDFVQDRSYSGTNGVYTAVGNDDLPITPEQWSDLDGWLEVRLLDNQRQVEVTIIGPRDRQYAPYRIAMSSGSGNAYNALHITGTGLISTDDYIDLVTGATNQTTAEEVGLEITNPYIDTLARAFSVGQYAAASQALTYTISTSGYLYNPGDVTFGKVAGARVETHNSKFRVDNATTGPAMTSFNASQDVLISDVNEKYAGMTMGEVSALWAGRTMLDYSLSPLKKNP